MPLNRAQALAKSSRVQRGVVRRPKNSKPGRARGARVVRNPKAGKRR